MCTFSVIVLIIPQDFLEFILVECPDELKLNAAAQTQHGVNKNWDSFQFSNDYADPLLMVGKKIPIDKFDYLISLNLFFVIHDLKY